MVSLYNLKTLGGVRLIRKRNSKKKGFTLIELIVVMSIILVLGSFLLPKFNGYREKAQKLKVIDTGRQIYLTIVESYIEGNTDFDADKIAATTEELLGLDSIEVIGDVGQKINISYEVDKKTYYLEFDEDSSGFIIRDESSKQIYPPVDSMQVLNIGEEDEKKDT